MHVAGKGGRVVVVVDRQMSRRLNVLVWDIPVRVFHWLLVICFAGAWITSESERLQLIHYAFGYCACLLVLIRVFWGLVGTRYARFTQFVKTPQAIGLHFMHILKAKDHPDLGHNPAGAYAMLGLMAFMLLIGITGYMGVKEYFGDWAGEAHEALATLALCLVILHLVAALVMSVIERENLVKAMLTGKKMGMPEQAIRYPHYVVGGLILGAVAYFYYLVVSGSLPSLTT